MWAEEKKYGKNVEGADAQKITWGSWIMRRIAGGGLKLIPTHTPKQGRLQVANYSSHFILQTAGMAMF